MQMLSIVTFIHGREVFSEDFTALCAALTRAGYEVDPIVLCDQRGGEKFPASCRCHVTPGTTKYARILFALEHARSDLVFFIDNDITPDVEAFASFAGACIAAGCAAGWGRIGSTPAPGAVPGMIRADKRLSHDLIRPLLWKTRTGISIPGQIFMLDRIQTGKLLGRQDTVFDDLTIGAAIRGQHLPILSSGAVLGRERPCRTMGELICQRRRWARGFSQVLVSSRGHRVFPLVILHGLAYHFLWIPFWAVSLFLLIWAPVPALMLLAAVILWLARFTVRELPWAVLYLALFPGVHCIWSATLIRECCAPADHRT